MFVKLCIKYNRDSDRYDIPAKNQELYPNGRIFRINKCKVIGKKTCSRCSIILKYFKSGAMTKMPRKNKDSNKNTADNKSIVINGDVNNSTIIIGDNSKLEKSESTEQQIEKTPAITPPPVVVGSQAETSKLIPFLCYAKENSIAVREFRERLKAENWIDPWFDEEDILPGQRWEESVIQAVHNSHAVMIFLSSIAVRKEGFFQKELKLSLDAAAEKPDGTIFIIPIRLDVCEVPERLLPYQYVDYFGDEAQRDHVYSSLIAALKIRARSLRIKI